MAFLTDPSIAQQVRTPNLAQTYLQAAQINGATQRQQMGAIDLQQAQRQQQQQQTLAKAYQDNTGPDGTLNRQGVITALSQNGMGQQAQAQAQQWQQQDAARLKAQQEQQGAALKNGLDKVNLLDKVFQGVTPETYGTTRAGLIAQGIAKPEELPEQYDPAAIQQIHQQTLGYKDKLQQALDQHKADEVARHNAATESTAAATQNETAAYHGIEAKQRQQQIGIEAGQLGVARQRLGTDQGQAVEAQAQQIANGDVKGLSQSRNNPFARAVMARVYEINPKYTDSLYTANQDLRSTKPTSAGATMTRLGTSILHADQALQGSQDLGFSPGLATGIATAGTAAYKQSAEFLTGEVGKLVTGGNLTVSEGNKISSDLLSSRQGVRDSALHKIIDLGGGKIKASMEQYTNATQNPFPTDRVFNDPEISASLHKHGVIGNDAPSPTAGAPAGATHIVPGSDGKMHYTDGKKDLGVVAQ
jgi:hypothetical protein